MGWRQPIFWAVVYFKIEVTPQPVNKQTQTACNCHIWINIWVSLQTLKINEILKNTSIEVEVDLDPRPDDLTCSTIFYSFNQFLPFHDDFCQHSVSTFFDPCIADTSSCVMNNNHCCIEWRGRNIFAKIQCISTDTELLENVNYKIFLIEIFLLNHEEESWMIVDVFMRHKRKVFHSFSPGALESGQRMVGAISSSYHRYQLHR